MLFLFIIRRLNPRLRAIVGVSVTFVGLALLGLAATVASWLFIHGIITAVVGIAFCIAAFIGKCKARAAEDIPVVAGDRSLVMKRNTSRENVRRTFKSVTVGVGHADRLLPVSGPARRGGRRTRHNHRHRDLRAVL